MAICLQIKLSLFVTKFVTEKMLDLKFYKQSMFFTFFEQMQTNFIYQTNKKSIYKILNNYLHSSNI